MDGELPILSWGDFLQKQDARCPSSELVLMDSNTYSVATTRAILAARGPLLRAALRNSRDRSELRSCSGDWCQREVSLSPSKVEALFDSRNLRSSDEYPGRHRKQEDQRIRIRIWVRVHAGETAGTPRKPRQPALYFHGGFVPVIESRCIRCIHK